MITNHAGTGAAVAVAVGDIWQGLLWAGVVLITDTVYRIKQRDHLLLFGLLILCVVGLYLQVRTPGGDAQWVEAKTCVLAYCSNTRRVYAVCNVSLLSILCLAFYQVSKGSPYGAIRPKVVRLWLPLRSWRASGPVRLLPVPTRGAAEAASVLTVAHPKTETDMPERHCNKLMQTAWCS